MHKHFCMQLLPTPRLVFAWLFRQDTYVHTSKPTHEAKNGRYHVYTCVCGCSTYHRLDCRRVCVKKKVVASQNSRSGQREKYVDLLVCQNGISGQVSLGLVKTIPTCKKKAENRTCHVIPQICGQISTLTLSCIYGHDLFCYILFRWGQASDSTQCCQNKPMQIIVICQCIGFGKMQYPGCIHKRRHKHVVETEASTHTSQVSIGVLLGRGDGIQLVALKVIEVWKTVKPTLYVVS